MIEIVSAPSPVRASTAAPGSYPLRGSQVIFVKTGAYALALLTGIVIIGEQSFGSSTPANRNDLW